MNTKPCWCYNVSSYETPSLCRILRMPCTNTFSNWIIRRQNIGYGGTYRSCEWHSCTRNVCILVTANANWFLNDYQLILLRNDRINFIILFIFLQISCILRLQWDCFILFANYFCTRIEYLLCNRITNLFFQRWNIEGLVNRSFPIAYVHMKKFEVRNRT